MYDSARQRVGIIAGDPKEVLILDAKLNNVAEASLTTPYFWRNHRMVTPPVSKGFSEKEGSGGIDGVSRRWALERDLAVEEEVPIESLVDGEECWISNGARGFQCATLTM
ncbi:hypothetical protein N3K66_004571 [Trichothecium roseum]|uniref:Uncharacterized protein n=1 Tax=Trichothecium roseum TaxID=47278 RepID=A0ACC0V1K0_9HYPO|nr:hypothetical protein N3K66_004571 [Trichothecium roseum]